MPSSPWLPLEFLRNPFPFGIHTATGSSQGAFTMLGQAVTDIPFRNLNQVPQSKPGASTFSMSFRVRSSWMLGTSEERERIFTRWDMRMSLTPSLRTSPTRFAPTRLTIWPRCPILFTASASFRGVPIFPGPTIPRWKLDVPYPQYSNGTAAGISSSFVPWANSIYNAAQLRIEKRFSQGLQFLFTYLFEKSLDDSSLGSSGYSFLTGGLSTAEPNARDPNNLRLDRSLSTFSIPQIAELSFLYQLPFGRGRKYGANVNRLTDAVLGGGKSMAFIASTTDFRFNSVCAVVAA